jgi:hypothetical protein
LLNYGLLHENLFFETNGEFYRVWDRVKNGINEGRKRFANRLFAAHVKKAAKRYETWIESRSPGHIAAMRQSQPKRARRQEKRHKTSVRIRTAIVIEPSTAGAKHAPGVAGSNFCRIASACSG